MSPIYAISILFILTANISWRLIVLNKFIKLINRQLSFSENNDSQDYNDFYLI